MTKLDTAHKVTEVLAVIAVIVSLVFVALQVRQNAATASAPALASQG